MQPGLSRGESGAEQGSCCRELSLGNGEGFVFLISPYFTDLSRIVNDEAKPGRIYTDTNSPQLLIRARET